MAAQVIRRCAACGAKNRVPPGRVTNQARCGACKTALPPFAEPLDVDEATFSEVVRRSGVPVLVDFWAEWCGPCRSAAPVVRELAREMAGRAVILKVNTESEPGLSARYGVRAIPNFVILKSGAVIAQHPGLAPRDQMRRWLEDAGA